MYHSISLECSLELHSTFRKILIFSLTRHSHFTRNQSKTMTLDTLKFTQKWVKKLTRQIPVHRRRNHHWLYLKRAPFLYNFMHIWQQRVKNLLFLKSWKLISPDFLNEKKNLLADLASAEKITLTIRGEKIENKFWTKKFFFQKTYSFFSWKSEFLGDRKFALGKYIFEKSSRMVKMVFAADAKSTSRIVFFTSKIRR